MRKNSYCKGRANSKHIFDSIENSPVYKALKDYRYKQSVKEKIKPYFIFNNAQLEEIIKTNPQTLEELNQ